MLHTIADWMDSEREVHYSLKWSLIGIVVACWIVPLLLISFVTGYFISNKITTQITTTLTDSIKSNEKLCEDRLGSALSSSRYASYDLSIRTAYSRYGGSDEVLKKMSLSETVQNFLSKQYKYDDKFLSTILYFHDDPSTVYYVNNQLTNGSYSHILEFKRDAHAQTLELSRKLGTQIGFLNVNGNVYMVRNLVMGNYEPYAVLIMQLNTSALFDNMKNVAWSTNVNIWLNDTPINLRGAPYQLDDGRTPSFRPGQMKYTPGDATSRIIGSSSLDGIKLSYVIDVDSSAIMEEFSGFQFALIAMSLLIAPLLLLVIRFFYINVNEPIGSLVRGSQEIEKGRFGFQIIRKNRNEEFNYLTVAFNQMSAELKHQFDKIYREELALRDARIMALQSQINPHFLNNTLEIINWESRMAGDIKVSRMIESLSTMLDAAMDRKKKPTVHLSEEMMYVDAYLYIISERLGKRLVIRKEIDDSLLDLYVPRLVMQPVIENAVEHGIQPNQGGEITIRIYREGNSLLLEVENDGILTPEDEKRIAQLLTDDYDASNENANNLGIRNVHQRLRILYGDNSGLSIKMNRNNRVLAKIVIAINLSEQ